MHIYRYRCRKEVHFSIPEHVIIWLIDCFLLNRTVVSRQVSSMSVLFVTRTSFQTINRVCEKVALYNAPIAGCYVFNMNDWGYNGYDREISLCNGLPTPCCSKLLISISYLNWVFFNCKEHGILHTRVTFIPRTSCVFDSSSTISGHLFSKKRNISYLYTLWVPEQEDRQIVRNRQKNVTLLYSDNTIYS